MVEIIIPDFVESYRKWKNDVREAKAVDYAKFLLKAKILEEETLTWEDDYTREELIDLIEIEIRIATTKEDIHRIITKLKRLHNVKYPSIDLLDDIS